MFCNYVLEKKITYLRIITKGDPVPLLPFKATYFSHPCEDNVSIKKIKEHPDFDEFEKCSSLIKMIPNPLTMKVYPRVNYDGNLDCLTYNTRLYMSNPLSHTIYLDVLFVNAVDIKNFASTVVSFTTKEITRNPKTKSTTCRVILYDDTYKAAFFDMTDATGEFVDDLKAEEALLNEKSAEIPPEGEGDPNGDSKNENNPSNGDNSPNGDSKNENNPSNGDPRDGNVTNVNIKLNGNNSPNEDTTNVNIKLNGNNVEKKGGDSGYGILKTKSVVEDIFVNRTSFNKLIENAVNIEVSPLPMYGTIQNTFKEEKQNPSPKLCCVGLKQKGGNKSKLNSKKNKTKKNKTNKTKKNKTNKTKKNKSKFRKA
jgi:hypothetical protein